jgi:hypothetical protein
MDTIIKGVSLGEVKPHPSRRNALGWREISMIRLFSGEPLKKKEKG